MCGEKEEYMLPIYREIKFGLSQYGQLAHWMHIIMFILIGSIIQLVSFCLAYVIPKAKKRIINWVSFCHKTEISASSFSLLCMYFKNTLLNKFKIGLLQKNIMLQGNLLFLHFKQNIL